MEHLVESYCRSEKNLLTHVSRRVGCDSTVEGYRLQPVSGPSGLPISIGASWPMLRSMGAFSFSPTRATNGQKNRDDGLMLLSTPYYNALLAEPGQMDSLGCMFLHQVSELNPHIDQINDDVETRIRKTREVELAIVQSSEKEQAARIDAEKWKRLLIRRENQYSDLSAITGEDSWFPVDGREVLVLFYGFANGNVTELEEKLKLMEKTKSDISFAIGEDREAFIATCKSFQQDQEMDYGAGYVYALIPRKFTLLSEVDSLKKDSKSVRFADEALSRNKMERFRQLQHVNTELQSEMDAENVQNEHLLRRIDGLNDALVNLPGCQDIARLEEDFDLFSEEKRNLEDGIVTLQQQLPLLLSQEQKLGNLLKDQQRALQSLEQKIEEVKLLQEAYENDFQNQMKYETPVNQSSITNPQNFIPEGDVSVPVSAFRQQQTQYGTWDSYQGQPGKRHRII